MENDSEKDNQIKSKIYTGGSAHSQFTKTKMTADAFWRKLTTGRAELS